MANPKMLAAAGLLITAVVAVLVTTGSTMDGTSGTWDGTGFSLDAEFPGGDTGSMSVDLINKVVITSTKDAKSVTNGVAVSPEDGTKLDTGMDGASYTLTYNGPEGAFVAQKMTGTVDGEPYDFYVSCSTNDNAAGDLFDLGTATAVATAEGDGYVTDAGTVRITNGAISALETDGETIAISNFVAGATNTISFPAACITGDPDPANDKARGDFFGTVDAKKEDGERRLRATEALAKRQLMPSFIGKFHGKYCGPDQNGPGGPSDHDDACCKTHDWNCGAHTGNTGASGSSRRYCWGPHDGKCESCACGGGLTSCARWWTWAGWWIRQIFGNFPCWTKSRTCSGWWWWRSCGYVHNGWKGSDGYNFYARW